MRQCREALAILAAASLLAACSGGGDSAPGNGTVSISLMDRAVDGVAAVTVTVSGMSIKPKGDGPAIPLDLMADPGEDTITVNLLDLDSDNPAVLVDRAVIREGSYNWIEMEIEDAEIAFASVTTDEGAEMPLDVDVPSGRIRLVSGFEVRANEGLRILFDWDVRKGLTHAVGRDMYLLRPAFRILNVDEIGLIGGSVDVAGLCPDITYPDPDQPVVYVFSEDAAAVDPVDVTAAEISADVVVDADSTYGYSYETVVMPGTYVLALTCSEPDDPAATVLLEPFTTVVVAADMATEPVDFEVPAP